MSSGRSKLLTYWVVPEAESSSLGHTPYYNTSSRCLPKWTCFSLVTAGALILCGLLATLWVWTRYGSSGFPHHGGTPSGSDMKPGLASLLLGPVVTVVGVVCIVLACVVHEVRLRQDRQLDLQVQQVMSDSMAYGDTFGESV